MTISIGHVFYIISKKQPTCAPSVGCSVIDTEIIFSSHNKALEGKGSCMDFD